MGVPTPNLFTGMQNIHGPQEWISVQDMARATEVCIELAGLWSAEPMAAKGSAYAERVELEAMVSLSAAMQGEQLGREEDQANDS